MTPSPINIVGAGLAGALLGVLFARRGFQVALHDRRPDPRTTHAVAGRSINLALAARGIEALEKAGVMERVHPLLIPMRGRMVHDMSGAVTLQPYGQQEDEVIYSVGRAALNRVLIEEAARYPRVSMRFEQTCVGADPERNILRFRTSGDSGTEFEIPLTPTIATDGAGSAVRTSLANSQLVVVRETWLDHDYKELTIPPRATERRPSGDRAATERRAREPPAGASEGTPSGGERENPQRGRPPAGDSFAGRSVTRESPGGGGPVLDTNSLHIWPRGGFMLIALPNTDGSFTATLFLARTGPNSFACLDSASAVADFFRREFPDVVPLLPELTREFLTHPQGQLGTVHLDPWHLDGKVLLLGDAAHAIVPFHGQGMNAAFEDCRILDSLLDQHASWSSLFAALARVRQPNTAAIAAMALENYTEMRDTVLDPAFVRQKAIAMELERRFPDRFIPRYSMVMFHPEIPYAEAQRRGAVQAGILAELDARGAPTGDVDIGLAEKLVKERLAPL